MKTQSEVGYQNKRNKHHHSPRHENGGQAINQSTDLSKRGKVMNASTLIRTGLWTLLSLLVIAALSFGQGKLKNGGTFTNSLNASFKEIINYTSAAGTINNSGPLNVNVSGGTGNLANSNGTLNGTVTNTAGGTIVVAGNYSNTLTNTNGVGNGAGITTNNTATSTIKVAGALLNSPENAANFNTQAGTVEYTSTAASQDINVNVASTKYGALAVRGDATGDAKTLLGDLTVDGTITLENATLTVSTYALTVKGTNGISNAGGGALSAASGTVDYAGNVNQTIFPSTGYGTLKLTGGTGTSRTKTSAGALTAATALDIQADMTLDVSTGTFTYSGLAAALTVASNAKIKVAAGASITAATEIGGTFEYYGGDQNIVGGGVIYTNLTLSGPALTTKTFANTTTAVKGNYDVTGHAGSRAYGTGTFQFAGAAPQTISGMSSESFYILQFTNGGTKTLGGASMGAARMDVIGAGVVTNNVTTVTLTNIGNVSLTVASGAELINSGSKEITMNGDLENDGTVTNSGTISVY